MLAESTKSATERFKRAESSFMAERMTERMRMAQSAERSTILYYY